MESKFYSLINEYYARNNIGGFLRGDHVSFSDGWEKAVKDLGYTDEMITSIKRLASTKNRLIVTDITRNNNGTIGNPQAASLPEDIVINVAEEISPGLPIDPIPVPLNLLQRVSNGHNLGEIPDAWKHPVTITNAHEYKDSDNPIKQPDYSKYKDLAKQHILDRQKDGFKPEQTGADVTGQVG